MDFNRNNVQRAFRNWPRLYLEFNRKAKGFVKANPTAKKGILCSLYGYLNTNS